MAIEWPPHPYKHAYDDMALYTAWCAGDVDHLMRHYSRAHIHRQALTDGTFMSNEGTYFWGRPNPQNNKRRHLPVAAELVRASAQLLVSKPPHISAGPDDIQLAEDGTVEPTPLDERLDLMFAADTFSATLTEAMESSARLGGVFFRPWWDRELVDHVVPGYVAADRAVPTFKFDQLTAVTFWQVLQPPQGDHRVWRYLEKHEPGYVQHELWVGDEGSLGERVDVGEHPVTEWIAKEGDGDGVISTGIDGLDVVYAPNRRPALAWRDHPGLAQLGGSDLEGILGELDALDEAASGLIRDVRDGASRILIDEMLLRDNGPGRGASFDQDQGVFMKMSGGIGSSKEGPGGIESVQFAIRWQEYAQTRAEIMASILEAVGLSAQSFNDGRLSTAVTATEIDSRNAISERTRKTKLNHLRPALVQFADICVRLDAAQFNTGVTMKSRPMVRFPAQSSQSDLELAQTIGAKKSGGFMSEWEAIRQANPDWTDPEVEAEQKRIQEDKMREARMAFGMGLDDEGEESTEPTEGPVVDGEGPDEGVDEYVDEYVDAEGGPVEYVDEDGNPVDPAMVAEYEAQAGD